MTELESLRCNLMVFIFTACVFRAAECYNTHLLLDNLRCKTHSLPNALTLLRTATLQIDHCISENTKLYFCFQMKQLSRVGIYMKRSGRNECFVLNICKHSCNNVLSWCLKFGMVIRPEASLGSFKESSRRQKEKV